MKKLSIYIISFLSVVLVGLIVVSLLLYNRLKTYDNELLSKQQQIEQLKELSNEAIVVRRASEQLEEIAYQQKAISDIQRAEALKQKLIADEQKLIAEKESKKSNIAKAKAEDAFVKMEEQKVIADIKKEEAIVARKKSDTLARLVLGKSLFTQSVAAHDIKNYDLARLLSLCAWDLTINNGGEFYTEDAFNTLNLVSESQKTSYVHSGAVRDIIKKNDKEFFSISDIGEIYLLNKNKEGVINKHKLFSNSNYLFRKAIYLEKEDFLLAISYDGKIITYSKNQIDKYKINESKILDLEILGDKMIITSKNSISYLNLNEINNNTEDLKTKPYIKELNLRDEISATYFSADLSIIAYKNGDVITLNADNKEIQNQNFLGKYVTCIAFNGKYIYAYGLNTGEINLYDNQNYVITNLVGHVSSIVNIAWDENLLLTSSNDRTIRLWNLADINIVSLITAQADSWIMSSLLIPSEDKIISGDANGNIITSTYSPSEMESAIKQELKREFTKQEWSMYVGVLAPYKKYMINYEKKY